MTFSNFQEAVILNALFAGTVYIGLKTADPGEANAGGTEPTIPTGNYARVVSPETDWETATEGAIQNDTALEFGESSAAWSTGATPLTHFIIMDAAAAGNMLGYGELTTPRTVNAAGVILRFPVGELDVTLD